MYSGLSPPVEEFVIPVTGTGGISEVADVSTQEALIEMPDVSEETTEYEKQKLISEAEREKEPVFVRGPTLQWDVLSLEVEGYLLPQEAEVLKCPGCSVSEINDLLGYVYEWKIVKDYEVLYFHSGANSLGLAIIKLQQSGMLERDATVVLMDDVAKEYYVVADLVELSRDDVAENEYFTFETYYEGQIILFTCLDANVPWHPYTPKLIIQLRPM